MNTVDMEIHVHNDSIHWDVVNIFHFRMEQTNAAVPDELCFPHVRDRLRN